MMSEDIANVVQGMTHAWNDRDLDLYHSYLTEDVVWEDPAMVQAARGRDEVRSFSESVLRALPDFRYTIRAPVCFSDDGSRCAVPWRYRGDPLRPTGAARLRTHRPKGDLPRVDLLEFRGGRVSRIETYFDVLVAAESDNGVVSVRAV